MLPLHSMHNNQQQSENSIGELISFKNINHIRRELDY